MTHQKYRSDIDGLRALAVLSVIGFHAFPSRFPGGFVGVDIFFVISGYLISGIIFDNLDKNTFSFRDFYSRRVKRIFPALIFVLFACIIVGWFVLLPAEYGNLGKNIAAGAGFVSNLIFWQEAGYFDVVADKKPLLHLWSLGIEEQFYFIWPPLLWLALKKRLSFRTLCIALIVISFSFNVIHVHADPVGTFYSPISRIWELLLGALLSHLKRNSDDKSWEQPLQASLDFLGAILIAAAFFFVNRASAFPGWWAILPTIGTCFILYTGPKGLLNRAFLSNKVLVGIGLISYPLYLWHWPILSFGRIMKGSDPLSTRTRIGAVIGSFVLAWLTYEFVEKPIRFGKRKKAKVAILCTLMVALGLLGLGLYENRGLSSRYPKEIRDVVGITDVYSFFHYSENLRVPLCHSTPVGEDPKVRFKTCVENKRPLIFIWGDSYAASLYPGLKSLQRKKYFGIGQYTAGNAPPFFDQDKKAENLKDLRAINSEALEAVSQAHPDVILLDWMYDGMNAPDSQEKTLSELKETLGKIKSASSTSKIIVIGPFPTWKETLVHDMYEYWNRTSPHQTPPQYMSFGLEQAFISREKYMSVEIPKLGVTYISVYGVFCNADGCLTRVGPEVTDLTAIDFGHLTPAASTFLFQKIYDRLFQNPN